MQVLLVVVLSVVERLGLRNLRGDGSETAFCQNLEGEPRSASVRAATVERVALPFLLAVELQCSSMQVFVCVFHICPCVP